MIIYTKQGNHYEYFNDFSDLIRFAMEYYRKKLRYTKYDYNINQWCVDV